MSKPTTAELNNLLLALTLKVNNLLAANTVLIARLDAADVWCDGLRDYTVEAVETLTAKREPLRAKVEPSQRIPRAEFDRALADLRADTQDDARIFARAAILDRAATLRTMAANRAEAAH